MLAKLGYTIISETVAEKRKPNKNNNMHISIPPQGHNFMYTMLAISKL